MAQQQFNNGDELATVRAILNGNAADAQARLAVLEGQKQVGFIDYNDASTAITPLVVPADTWVDVPNDGQGSFTNKQYPPSGISELMDVLTGRIDPTQLSLGDNIFIRHDMRVIPTENNTDIELRYVLGTGAGEYQLEAARETDISGAGVPFPFSGSYPIYMGDTNTRDNPIIPQLRCTSDCTVVNLGSVIIAHRYGSQAS